MQELNKVMLGGIMKLKEKRTSLFEEGLEAIRKRFVKNPVNRIILAHFYSLPGWPVLTIEEIKQVVVSQVVSQCSMIPDEDPEVTLDQILDISIEYLERDNLLEKTELGHIGYRITPIGNNIARVLQSIESYAIFESEQRIEGDLMEKISS